MIKIYIFMAKSWFLNSFSFLKYLFIWMQWILVVTYRLFSYGRWGLIPWPQIEPEPPALGVQSRDHWTTREVAQLLFHTSEP